MDSKKDYKFELSDTASLVLAIIPPTNLVFSVVTRVLEKNYLAAVLRCLPVVGTVAWIMDIVSMSKNHTIWRFL